MKSEECDNLAAASDTPNPAADAPVSLNVLRERILRKIIRVACAVGAVSLVLSALFAKPFYPAPALAAGVATLLIFFVTLLPDRFRILSAVYPWLMMFIGAYFAFEMGPRTEVFVFFTGGLFIGSLVLGGKQLASLGIVGVLLGVTVFISQSSGAYTSNRTIWLNSAISMASVVLPAAVAGRMLVWALDRALQQRDMLVRRLMAESRVLEETLRDLERTRAQLTHAQKVELIGQVAGGIAHDMNNSLSVIMGEASMLKDAVAREREQILEAAEYAAKLTRQLMVFGRRDMSQPKPMDLAVTLRSLVKAVRRVISSEIALEMDIENQSIIVTADQTQLLQVLLNLATNARDAMPSEGGTLRIRLFLRGTQAVVEVSDNGSGIPDIILPNIFDPFFTTKPRGRGTGLGLANVKKLVEEMGGTIEVETEIGTGTTFRFRLPVVQQQVIADTAESSMAPARSGTVLVVDDDVRVRAVVYATLERAGFHVLEAATPDGALGIARDGANTVDLLVTDVVMPGGGGAVVIRRLVAEFPNVRVLVMSGYNDDETLRRGIARGDWPFVAKPFTGETLLQAVDNALQSSPPI